MFSEGIIFKGFNKKKNNSLLKKKLKQILNNKNFVIETFSKNYKYSFNRNTLRKISKFKNFRVIGMGGSILGSQAIYDFFQHKIKKKFEFINNIDSNLRKPKKQKYTNLIISKSGNTIETIANTNILVNKKDKNIIITENKKSNLFSLAEKLKAEVIHHNNFIGGRYSVLSEVGMLHC